MTVACMVKKGAWIAAKDCVTAQADERCFCMKAVTALQQVSENDVEESATLRERTMLVTLRGRAAGMYRQPPEKQFAGPALRVYNEEIQSKTSGSGTGPGAPFVTPPAQRESPAVQSGVVPAVPTTGRLCACTRPIKPKSTRDQCPICHAREMRAKAIPPRWCKTEGCKTQLRAPNTSDHCRVCRSRLERKGAAVPLPPPKENVVPIKPVEMEKHPGVVEAVFGKLSGDGPTYKLHGDPPDPKTLSHEYLLACVQEARRRIADLESSFTFTITPKEG